MVVLAIGRLRRISSRFGGCPTRRDAKVLAFTDEADRLTISCGGHLVCYLATHQSSVVAFGIEKGPEHRPGLPLVEGS